MEEIKSGEQKQRRRSAPKYKRKEAVETKHAKEVIPDTDATAGEVGTLDFDYTEPAKPIKE